MIPGKVGIKQLNSSLKKGLYEFIGISHLCQQPLNGREYSLLGGQLQFQVIKQLFLIQRKAYMVAEQLKLCFVVF